jgi:PAS domain S-box-containing protein
MASRATKITAREVDELRERADKLAEEAEQLRFADDLSARLGNARGPEDLAVRLAGLTLEATKGTNAVAYCRTDDHFWVASALGHAHEAQVVDDEKVRAVFESGEAAELLSTSDDPALMTWALPLVAGGRTAGVLVAENTQMGSCDARERFGSFFRYAAMLLREGVRDHEELSRANDGLRATTERLASEVAQREEAEEQLRKTARDLEGTVELRTRAFRTLSRVSETLMRAYDERELLQNVCDTVVDVGGYVLCWVGFVEHDEAKTVRPVASAGRDADYVDRITVTWGREPSGRGPTGRSIRRRKPVASRDLRADFNFGLWKNEAVSRGYQSSASFPLVDSRGEVFGAIAIYSAKAGAFDSDEMQLLSELAGDLAFGIGALRERKARAEADKRVRDSARYARGLVEVNDSPFALVNPDGRISDVNRATEEATGLPRNQLIGTDFADYFTDSDAARAVYQRVLSEGAVKEVPLSLKHVSGSVMDVEYDATVYRDETGELRGVFAAARDVTERKKAYAQEARLAAIVTSSQDAILTENLDGVIGSWNEAAERLYGFSAQEMLGANVERLVPSDREGESRALVDRIRRGEEIANYETVRVRRDGTEIDVSLALSPIRDDSGRVVSVSLIARDISERRRAERERAARLRFAESMDRINRAIQGSDDLDHMMRDVLDVVRTLFDSDRAFLLYPCDPEADAWSVPMESTSPDFPGAMGLGVPMTDEFAQQQRVLLDTSEPVAFGGDAGHPIPRDVAKRFDIKSLMSIAVRPKVGRPWQFGVQQCSYARVWTDEQTSLVQEIARRLEDALSTGLARRELELSEAEYRRLVETASEGVWAFAADFTTTFANPRLAEMMGYSPNELTGRPVTDFLFKEDVPEHEKRLARRREGLSEHYELRLRAKDGGVVWASVSATPMIDDAGQFVGSFAMVTDITERKLVEEARRASDREYWTLLQKIAAAVVVHGADTRILTANETAKRLLGFSAEELLGKSVQDAAWEFVREDGTPMPPEEYPAAKVAASGQALEDYVVGLRRPGDGPQVVTWTLVSAGPVFGARGELVQIIVTFVDITARKQVQEALQDSEAKYREIFDNVSDALTVFDVTEDGRFRFAGINPTAERIRGIPQAAAYGRYYDEVVDTEQVARSLPNFRRCVEMGAPLAYEEWHTGGGNEWYLETILLPVLDGSGRATRLIMLGHDITRRKQAEDVRIAKQVGARSERGER